MAKEKKEDQGKQVKNPVGSGSSKKKKTPVKFECGFAPAGNSTVSFVHKFKGDEHTYNLNLENKIFILPDKLDDKETERYRAALTANNFIDVTVNIGRSYNKSTGKYTYKAMHPEHTDRNRINCTMGITLLDDKNKPVVDKNNQLKTQNVNIVEGLVVTGDKTVYNALIQYGFYDAGTKEAKNGK